MKLTINNNLCTSVEDVRKYASEDVAVFVEEYLNDAPYICAHTSGSTGTPKEIHLAKCDLRASAKYTNDFFGLNSDSLFYLNLSPSYIAGKMMIVRALELGAKIIEEPASNEPLKNYDSVERISLGSFVPSQLMYLINNPEKLALIDNMIIGGGKLPIRIERWLADMGINAYTTYGMTETCSHVALAHVGTETKPFKALGDITFEIDDRGCLVINTPHFESTKRLVTNDIVNLLSDTEFYWCGRFDNVINTGGKKVFPEEIEPKIATIIRNANFFVTSEPSDKWGEDLVLALEYSSMAEGDVKRGEIRQELIEKMKQVLPPYSVPRRYVAVKQFKRTTTGKLIRKI